MQYLCIVHTYVLCGYTRHLRTCRNVAIQVNRPSGISQAVAIAAHCPQGVNIYFVFSLVCGDQIETVSDIN